MHEETAAVLDPLTLPMQGSRLIEASAGTGKTWTIAALYLRLVLGHGCPARLPAEILVMTFTKAATRELSDRIRRRLLEAAACCRGTRAVAADDRFLSQLLAAFPDGPARQQAAWRLAQAAEAMDDAAVHTIDAWCQRMLREHAFDSGCLFDETLRADDALVQAEAMRDYWRQNVYPLDGDALETVLALWKDIEALAGDLRRWAGKPLPAHAGQGSLADALLLARRQQAQALAALKAGWVQRADAMLAWLAPIWNDQQHAARKAVPGEANGRRWIDALKAWALDPAAVQPDLKSGAIRLRRSEIAAGLAQAGAAADLQDLPEGFGAIETLMAATAALPTPEQALRQHAAACVAGRVLQIKAQAGSFGFADMLERLDTALDPAAHGVRAERLRQRILAQYPAALIDEFQDTSPVQLRIFDRIYRIADDDPRRVLLLIGDPKQAIYGFRGADIHSYLLARGATQGRHHVLGTNHRSTQALVAAVNQVFQTAEQRAGDGAFLFGPHGAASALPFVPVAAQGRAERLVTGTGTMPAVTLVADATPGNKAGSLKLFSALCAERIVTLLNDPGAGFETAHHEGPHGQPGPAWRRLRPADIAVLVRSATEADAVRHAMLQRGLACVYLSDKDTVFQTPEAFDLLRLLQAVAAPRDPRLARAALATALLGLSLAELLALAGDDECFDRQCELLLQLNLVWKAQGVLAMVRTALHAFGLPARWLAPGAAAAQGERRLTNVLHLAELLQSAAVQAEGEPALIRWLQQQMADGDAGVAGDELVLRLESDADLVRLVTVHKSKGLEYPVVFLPFAAHFRELLAPGESARDLVLMLPDGTGRRRLVVSPTKDELAVAEKERLREDLRLLYVALTRARHALWLGVAGLQGASGKASAWPRSALGYLLSGPRLQPPEQRLRDMLALSAACPQIVVEVLPAADTPPMPALTPLAAGESLPALLPAPVYAGRFDRTWAISSYSALVRDATTPAGSAKSASAVWEQTTSGAVPSYRLREDEPDDTQAGDAVTTGAMPQRAADQPWHRFPRGAQAGNFLHDQLEWLAGEQFGLDGTPALQEALARRCERQGWGHRAADVLAWLRRVCTTPMPAVGVPLAGLATIVPEMEFWFPSDGLRASQVDALCRQHLQPGRSRPQLPERVLKGMLMGFADLVFEHAGRFWVLDYKSNALGHGDADYTAEAMQAAMLQHRYDVQAALYLLALHRLLRTRLGAAYVPAQQLGGALYLFLRGVSNDRTAGCCHVAPPLALIDALDGQLLRGAAAQESP